jgi:serine phosphatase RsbU (regulator of sigma subunit)
MEEQKKAIHREHELKVARSLQQILLGSERLPSESGLDLAVHYEPASEVAGDWYGYFYIPKTHESVLLVCDVTGHGASSALVTAMIASLFASYREVADVESIADFAKALNKCLYSLGRGVATSTAFLAKISNKNGSIDYINFGHPFPIVMNKDGVCHSLNKGLADSILGYAGEVSIAVGTSEYLRGDLLLVYTDGLLENGRNRPLSRKALSRLLQERKHRSLKYIVDDLVQSAVSNDNDNADDICIVGVRAA